MMNKTFNDSFREQLSTAQSAHTQRNQFHLQALKSTQDDGKPQTRQNLTSRGPAYKLKTLKAGSEVPKKKIFLQTETTPRTSIPNV